MTNEEAIKAIKANYPSGGYERLREALDMAIKALEEHKTGRWISEIAEREDWRGIKRKYFQPNSCSVCHNPSNIGEDYPYCPHCGAKMEGADND